jgi:hypothetical protein
MELEFEATLHLRNNVPQGDDAEWRVGDEEIDVLVQVDYEPYVPAKTYGPPENCYPAEGGGHEVLRILRDMSGDGDWEEIDSYPLPESVESYLAQCVEDKLKEMDEEAAEAKAEAQAERRSYWRGREDY